MFTVGSLFDGTGGFPLSAFMAGGVPLWASEIEPYPIAVTKSRFPHMKHLGSVTSVRGYNVEPVDVITFGSPCQDLSVAGKRAGLKHEDNGDEETTRSGLFMDAVRIIKEMRDATNGRYPTFAVWENVPGAFNSNKGEDFRIVLEELVKIVEPSATMPDVPPFGWPYADTYGGDGWSLAYRVLDAQYWGVPQRRRRIYLVLDLRGGRAREVLFERDGLRGYFEKGESPWETSPRDVADSSGTADCERNSVAYGFPLGFRPENVRLYDETATTLCNGTRAGFCNGVIVPVVAVVSDGYNQALTGDKTMSITGAASDIHHIPGVVMCYDARGNGDGDIAPTITGDHNNRVTDYTSVLVEQQPFCKSARARSSDDVTTWKHAKVANTLNVFDISETRVNEIIVEERPIVLDRAFYNQGVNAQYDPQYYDDGTVPTIVAKGPSAVAYGIGNGQANQSITEEQVGALTCMHDQQAVMAPPNYIVRRLTPTECCRLQGFPDGWGDPEPKSEFTDEEYKFWLDVRNTHAAINGRQVKDYNTKQMLTWYNKLHTDSAEYKMWGNGIALPNALYVMQGIADTFK